MVDTLFTHDPQQPYNLHAPPGIPKFFAPPDPDTPHPTSLDFHVLIASSSVDSPWIYHHVPLHAPVSASLAFMKEQLRDYLVRERLRRDPPAPPSAKAPSSGGPSTLKGSNTTTSLANFFSRGRPRRPLPPRVAIARVYLTLGPDGLVEPVERKNRKRGDDFDAGWKFVNCVAKMDITARLESEWRILRELIIASRGQLKCFIATQGDRP